MSIEQPHLVHGQNWDLLPVELQAAYQQEHRAQQARVILGTAAVQQWSAENFGVDQVDEMQKQMSVMHVSDLAKLADAVEKRATGLGIMPYAESPTMPLVTRALETRSPTEKPVDNPLTRKHRGLKTIFGSKHYESIESLDEARSTELLRRVIRDYTEHGEPGYNAIKNAKLVVAYFGGMTGDEIAAGFGVSSSNAVQVARSKFLRRINKSSPDEGYLTVLQQDVPVVETPKSKTVTRITRSLKSIPVVDVPCKETDAEGFFAEDRDTREVAKKLCGRCVIRSACLQAALSLEDQPEGVWGGLDKRERKLLKASVPG